MTPKQKRTQWRQVWEALKLAVICAILFFGLCLLYGCRSVGKAVSQQQAAVSAGNLAEQKVASGVVGAAELNTIAAGSVEAAKSHADEIGKGHLEAAGQTLDRQKQVLAIVSVEVQKGHAASEEQAKAFTRLLADYQHLDRQWYVTGGRWLERAFWSVSITWLVLGLASAVLGLGNPLSWSAGIAKQLRLLLPLSNVFSWARKPLEQWYTQKQSRRA